MNNGQNGHQPQIRNWKSIAFYFALGFATCWLLDLRPGHYQAISSNGSVVVLDTKHGRVWVAFPREIREAGCWNVVDTEPQKSSAFSLPIPETNTNGANQADTQ